MEHGWPARWRGALHFVAAFPFCPLRGVGVANPGFCESRTPVAAQPRSLLISRHTIDAMAEPARAVSREVGVIGARVLVNEILIIFPLACFVKGSGGVFGRRRGGETSN